MNCFHEVGSIKSYTKLSVNSQVQFIFPSICHSSQTPNIQRTVTCFQEYKIETFNTHFSSVLNFFNHILTTLEFIKKNILLCYALHSIHIPLMSYVFIYNKTVTQVTTFFRKT